jgi:CBS domain containing-hemolysin-like protein
VHGFDIATEAHRPGDVRVLLADTSTFFEALGVVLGLVSIPALVILNALFVAAEFSLVAVRRTRVEEMIARGITRAKPVLAAIDHLPRTIAATQLGITLSSIALGWVSEVVLARDFEDAFGILPYPWNVIATHSVATALAFIGVTFVHVVFGELIPKGMALQSPDRIAIWLARPLNVFTLITRPVILLMSGTGTLILRLFGFKSEPESHLHSVEELALLVEDTEEAGLIAPEQAQLVQNVFELSDKRVRDCMVPREKMAALELTMPPEKVLDAVRQGAHTRMPVYQGDPDNIVGIVNTKNLFFLFSLRGVVVLADAMYDATFLKPDEELGTALQLFRKSRRPMALVRDDDGKIVGLLTLEDILEEIVGDIEDEHDQPPPPARRVRLRKIKKPAAANRPQAAG